MSENINYEKIKCEECGKEFKRISPSHLDLHGMTYDDYRNKYPGAPLTAPALRAQMKHSKNSMFKNDEKNKEETKKNDLELLEKLQESAEKIIDDIRPIETNIKSSQKKELFDIIKKYFPDAESDYEIKKFNYQNKLESVIITDISSPSAKIDFEFVNTFWHNPGFFYLSPQREQFLAGMGWKVITIKENAPTEFQMETICNTLSK